MNQKVFIQKYIESIKKTQEILLGYIENETSHEHDFNLLITFLKDHQILENKYELKALLHLISNISDNHQRLPNFFSKIEKIIQKISKEIQSNFSNFSIFYIFKGNKRILLFLFDSKIIIPDEEICRFICSPLYIDIFYPQYFYIEFESLFSEKIRTKIKSKEKIEIDSRKNGENYQYICKLIQTDSIEDFIVYMTKNSYSLSKTVIPISIYETNSFLLNRKHISLIEYAAFYGSIQIFKYLQLNGVEYPPSLNIFAIHGRNPDLIHLLEENHIFINEDKDCFDYYVESIKCHHIELMNYIKDNYFKDIKKDLTQFYLKNFEFYNFENVSGNIDMPNALYELCKNDYITIIDFYIKNTNFDINKPRKIHF